MIRRHFIASATILATGLPACRARAASPLSVFRIGYQKNGILAVARQQALIEKHLAPHGIAVEWAEFAYGPPLLEALSTGSVDFGTTGDVPPVFAQVASPDLVYVAATPTSGDSSAILVQKDSPITTLKALRGKKIGFSKGSSAHHFTVRVLDKAGLTYNDITPVYLAPSDAAAAFAQGSIDAWSIWDPFYAIAQLRQQARVLAPGSQIVAANSFYLANRNFIRAHEPIVRQVVDELARVGTWADANRPLLAQILADITAVDIDAEKIAVTRASLAVTPMTDDLVRQQQQLADRFRDLKLIPTAITVEDARWHWSSNT